MDHSEILQMFTLLKKSIDTFHSKNIHLENSGVFSMAEINNNCKKLEAYLNGDYEVLWRMERQEVKDLRERLESVPVEIVHMSSEDFDTMPPLERDVLDSEYDTMPPLEPILPSDEKLNTAVFSEYEVHPTVSNCDDMPPLKPIHQQYEKLNTALYLNNYNPSTTPLWSWPASSTSALVFNQHIRDL